MSNKSLVLAFTLLVVTTFPVRSFAEEETGNVITLLEGVSSPTSGVVGLDTESLSMLNEAMGSNNWALASGILLSILVVIANRLGLKDLVGAKAVPWVTAGLAMAGTVGSSIVYGTSITEAASQGLVVGVAAIGGWEMVLKHVLVPNKSDQSEKIL